MSWVDRARQEEEIGNRELAQRPSSQAPKRKKKGKNKNKKKNHLMKGGALESASVVDTLGGDVSAMELGSTVGPETSTAVDGALDLQSQCMSQDHEESLATISTRTMTTEQLEEIKRELKNDLNEHAIQMVKPLNTRKYL